MQLSHLVVVGTSLPICEGIVVKKNDTSKLKRHLYRLPDLLSLRIHEVSLLRRTILDKALKPLGLTRTQTLLLATLSNLGVDSNQKELSVAMGTSQVNVGAILDILETNGYIRRESTASDRRRKTLIITEAGHKALDESTLQARDLGKKILHGIDPDHVRIAQFVLDRIKENIIDLSGSAEAS